MVEEARSLAVTPSWAVATVISIMVAFGFFFHGSLKRFGKVRASFTIINLSRSLTPSLQVFIVESRN